jgi:hypothetical protein
LVFKERCCFGAGSIFEPATGWFINGSVFGKVDNRKGENWFSFGSVFGLPVKMGKIFDTNWSNFTHKHKNRFINGSVFNRLWTPMGTDERRCRFGAGSVFEPAIGWFINGSVFLW